MEVRGEAKGKGQRKNYRKGSQSLRAEGGGGAPRKGCLSNDRNNGAGDMPVPLLLLW